MPRKLTKTVKRISTKIKATLRKRNLLKKQAVAKKSSAILKTSKRPTPQKNLKKAPAPLTSTSLRTTNPSKISLKSHRPFWFIAQWQLSPLEIELWKKQSLKSELNLRLYSSPGHCVQSILIPGSVRNWHLYTEASDAFYVELGFFNKKNQFICFCRSQSAKMSLPDKSHKLIDPPVSQTILTLTSVQQTRIQPYVTRPTYLNYSGS